MAIFRLYCRKNSGNTSVYPEFLYLSKRKISQFKTACTLKSLVLDADQAKKASLTWRLARFFCEKMRQKTDFQGNTSLCGCGQSNSLFIMHSFSVAFFALRAQSLTEQAQDIQWRLWKLQAPPAPAQE